MGVAVYDPDESWRPYDHSPRGEMQMAKWASHPHIAIGSHVMYRHDSHGDVTDALVTDVRVKEFDDYPTSAEHPSGAWLPLPPWPLLTLETIYGPVRTRQARVRGSAGWLPLGWHERAEVAA